LSCPDKRIIPIRDNIASIYITPSSNDTYPNRAERRKRREKKVEVGEKKVEVGEKKVEVGEKKVEVREKELESGGWEEIKLCRVYQSSDKLIRGKRGWIESSEYVGHLGSHLEFEKKSRTTDRPIRTLG
jgi:hypothetical protein